MSTSQKHADFVRELMRDKPVEAIPGIGDRQKYLLNRINFYKSYNLLGQFLFLGRNRGLFEDWLQFNVPVMNSKHREDCYQCLNEWCKKYF